MLVGAAAGYVLGARAGRERYEQIKRMTIQAGKHPAVAQLVDHAGGLIDAGRYSMAAGLSAGSKGLKAIEEQTTSE